MVQKTQGSGRRINGLGHLTQNELDAVLTGAGLLKEGLRRVDDKDLLPDLRGELVRLETAAEGHLINRGLRNTRFGDDEEAKHG